MIITKGIEIEEITKNVGIIPIDLGLAKLKTSYHTFVHNFKLEEFINQLDNIELYYNEILNYFYEHCQKCYLNVYTNIETVTESGSKLRDVLNYFKFINHTKDVINEKLEIIMFKNVRTKRGLVNGLGSIVKFISGNLDAYDGEKYDKILNDLKNNQNNIERQMDAQYSISYNIIKEFNKTIKDVADNFDELQIKLVHVSNQVNDHVKIEQFRNILVQLNIIYSIMLQVVTDVENSLTFCKLGTLHPSLISAQELYEEMSKIVPYYKDRLPIEFKLENIWEIENLLEVNCKINSKEIVYFMNLPIVEPYDYTYYKMYSVPTLYENHYVTAIPKVRYVLVRKTMSKEIVLGLIEKCNDRVHTVAICSFTQVSHQDIDCEKTLIKSSVPSECVYVNLVIENNVINWIPELEQYLLIFVNKDIIKIKNDVESKEQSLKGIYLLKINNEIVTYKDQMLISSSNIRAGHPKLLDATKLDLNFEKQPNFTVTLQKLELNEIKLDQVNKVLEKTVITTDFNAFTIILYFIVVILICFIIYKNVKVMCSNFMCRRHPLEAPISSPTPEVLFRDGGVI